MIQAAVSRVSPATETKGKDVDKRQILDEAHHCGSRVWGARAKELTENTAGVVIGLTADSVRWSDGGKDVAQELFDGHIVKGYSCLLYTSPRQTRSAGSPQRMNPRVWTAFSCTCRLSAISPAATSMTKRCVRLLPRCSTPSPSTARPCRRSMMRNCPNISTANP